MITEKTVDISLSDKERHILESAQSLLWEFSQNDDFCWYCQGMVEGIDIGDVHEFISALLDNAGYCPD